MKSFIFTRFSLRIPQWESAVKIEEKDRENWFKYRANIFNAGLLPSVLGQTRPIDGIFLLMDASDTELFSRHIARSEKIIPVYTAAEMSISAVSRWLADRNVKEVAVHRVDSDDLISRHYVEAKLATANASAIGNEQSYIVAPNGYITDLSRFQPCHEDNSSFITVVYRKFSGDLDLGGDHRHILERSPVHCSEARWARIIHGSNVGNRFRTERIHSMKSDAWPSDLVRVNRSVVDHKLFSPVGSPRERLKNGVRLLACTSDIGLAAYRSVSFLKWQMRRVQV